MKVVKVLVEGTQSDTVRIEAGATKGAIFGVNLYVIQDGVPRLARLDDFSQPAVDDGIPVVSTDWSLIDNIPANVVAVENLASSGLVVRLVDGSWVTRSVAAAAGETTVTNPAGEAGNVVVGLADLANGGIGALLAISRDGKGRVNGARAATQADIDTALGYEAVELIEAGANVAVDGTNPRRPVVSASAASAVTREAGTALGGHRVVRSNNGPVEYADCTVEAHSDDVLGLTVASALMGADVQVVTRGPVVEPSWAWTPGVSLWLGEDGLITQAPTVGASFDLVIGFAETATSAFIDIGIPIYH